MADTTEQVNVSSCCHALAWAAFASREGIQADLSPSHVPLPSTFIYAYMTYLIRITHRPRNSLLFLHYPILYLLVPSTQQ